MTSNAKLIPSMAAHSGETLLPKSGGIVLGYVSLSHETWMTPLLLIICPLPSPNLSSALIVTDLPVCMLSVRLQNLPHDDGEATRF